jgi:hypothetical protein
MFHNVNLKPASSFLRQVFWHNHPLCGLCVSCSEMLQTTWLSKALILFNQFWRALHSKIPKTNFYYLILKFLHNSGQPCSFLNISKLESNGGLLCIRCSTEDLMASHLIHEIVYSEGLNTQWTMGKPHVSTGLWVTTFAADSLGS